MPATVEGMVNVRYVVGDVQSAVDFYTRHFGFTVRSAALPAFADITRGHLRLLRAAGIPFRTGIVTGPGGQQILLEDRSGHPVELFQPATG